MKWKLYEGDCLKIMPELEDKSIDMILCDLPYGTTACKWDSIIPLEPLWEQYKRLIKDEGAIVLFGVPPFSSILISSNIGMFKYEWIWYKNKTTNFIHANNKPLRTHENISIFSKGVTFHANKTNNRMNYKPQGLKEINKPINRGKKGFEGRMFKENGFYCKTEYVRKYTNYPRSVLKFNCENKPLHPTQKPVALFEYLIKTYTNEGDLVLDNCAGSGTTGVACYNTNRNCIMIEKEPKYCDVIRERMHEVTAQKRLEIDKGV